MNTVVLPYPPSECSPNARCHWSVRAKAAKKYRQDCFWLAKDAKLTAPEEGKIHVSMQFSPPDKRRRDLDNCIASSKALLDGIADALKVNDSRFALHTEMCEIVKGGKVIVTLTSGAMP